MKELKKENGHKEKGYEEKIREKVTYLMRVANVTTKKIGHKLLEIAIINYLHNPNLELEELLPRCLADSPMILSDEEECFEKMKEAIQTVNTKHSEKLEDDAAVYRLITNIASEIRIRELIKRRESSKKLKDIDEEITTTFCKVATRRIMKPEATFMEVLNHTAGRCGYDAVEDLIIDLYKVVDNSDYEEEMQGYQKNGIKKEKRRKKIAATIIREVEATIILLIEQKDNIIF